MAISSVSFFCVNRSVWDANDAAESSQPSLASSTSAGSPLDPYDAILPTTPASAANGANLASEHPCASLKRLLSIGSFYFAANGSFDLSTRLDKRVGRGGHHDVSQYDDRFVWNTFMIGSLVEFRSRLESAERRKLDQEGFLLLAIQGFAAVFDMSRAPLTYTKDVESHKPQNTSLALVSRLSWKRAGTRFNTRGVDDDGNVANFVESEIILCHEGVSASYVQLRGSVPLFWEQPGLQAFSARIQITRPRQASQPAFDRHFAQLLSHYSRVHALNLLGTRDAETSLSNAYAEHMRLSMAVDQAVPPEDEEKDFTLNDEERLGITNFDFHAVSRNHGGLDGVRAQLEMLGPLKLKREDFFCTIVDNSGTVRRRQRGVFRTNCLDCLDRTNVVQAMLSESSLLSFFEKASRHRESFESFSGGAHPVWTHHRTLWAENGDALSRIYAGTGALNSTYTRTGVSKKTFGSFLSDAAKSAGRMYINNFQDKSKQNVIDALLGNMANQRSVEVFDPLHDAVNSELNARLDEYSSSTELLVFAGTWNLNARPPGESLLPWLFPRGTDFEPDIFALGFQEIVQLTPQQILLTDPAKLRVWEATVMNCLSQRPNKKSEYTILRSEQLVGTALTILIKVDMLPNVRQVEATTRKTGLKGMSGNKGGVAIRLSIHDTSFCFVTAHLAAGHSNVEERNSDYWTISRGLTFQRGRTIAGHDHIIWAGDFNYRVEMSNERARSLVKAGDVASLYACDQLNRSRHSVFHGFEEGALNFLPTYKYDVGSDTYDSSEKQRIPSWTDRILYLQNPEGAHRLKQTMYARAELTTSDHRPVYALFQAEVRIFDRIKRNGMRREILSRAKAGQGRAIAGDLPPHGSSYDFATRKLDEDDSDDEDDDHWELPHPSNSQAATGDNWFDADDSDTAATSAPKSTPSDVTGWSDDDEDDEDMMERENANATAHSNGNPFLLSRDRVLYAAKHSNGSASPTARRRAPPPAPARTKVTTASLTKGSEHLIGSQPTRLHDELYPAASPASSSASLPLESGAGIDSGVKTFPGRPGLGNRSSSYAGGVGSAVGPPSLVRPGLMRKGNESEPSLLDE